MSMPAEHVRHPPNLAELLHGIVAAPPLAVHGIASDSRRLRAGDVFLALNGLRSHGLDHADEALRNKVAAIVWEEGAGKRFEARPGVASIAVSNLGVHVGEISNRWFDTPSATVRVTGVTGTNGKTTVAWLIAQCLQMLGQKCAYLGTLGAGIGEFSNAGGLTTPDCVEVHRHLAEFRDAGASDAAIEVSSHGLQQRRVDGVRFDAAVFTNLSRDHIDYHGDMDAYGETKAQLFLRHAPGASIICIDDGFGRELIERCGEDAIAVATGAHIDPGRHRFLQVRDTIAVPGGIELRVRSSWGDGRCMLPLYGRFNVANAAEVIAVLCSRDVAVADALELISRVSAPPGRMQRVEIAAGPTVFVDYAHTPAALDAALSALQPHCKGRLWCVFGCGGDRDRGKRPLMGNVVEQLADRSVLTSDNPRTENPQVILAEIRAGMSGDAVIIEDRAAAIAWAIDQADDRDIVLIAGKGHEDYQVIGRQRVAFSDYRVAEANLRLHLNRTAQS